MVPRQDLEVPPVLTWARGLGRNLATPTKTSSARSPVPPIRGFYLTRTTQRRMWGGSSRAPNVTGPWLPLTRK